MASAQDALGLRKAINLTSLSERLLPLLRQDDTLDPVGNSDGALWVNRFGRGFKHKGQYSPTKTTMLLTVSSCVFSVFDTLNNLLICWSVTIP